MHAHTRAHAPQLVYNFTSFTLASMMACTVFFWLRLDSIAEQARLSRRVARTRTCMHARLCAHLCTLHAWTLHARTHACTHARTHNGARHQRLVLIVFHVYRPGMCVSMHMDMNVDVHIDIGIDIGIDRVWLARNVSTRAFQSVTHA